MSINGWREGMFQLCWRQHGGSGLSISMTEALELSTADRDWYLERIGEQRSREARAIEQTARQR